MVGFEDVCRVSVLFTIGMRGLWQKGGNSGC